VELLVTEIRGGQRGSCLNQTPDAPIDCADIALEMGMKTTETQTELIDGISSPSSTHNQPVDFQLVSELKVEELTAVASAVATDNNNHHSNLDINSLRNIKDIRCIDDDTASGRRVLFPPDNPETKL